MSKEKFLIGGLILAGVAGIAYNLNEKRKEKDLGKTIDEIEKNFQAAYGSPYNQLPEKASAEAKMAAGQIASYHISKERMMASNIIFGVVFILAIVLMVMKFKKQSAAA